MAHPTAHEWGDSVINDGEIPVIVGTDAGAATFGDGMWLVGVDIQPGT